MRSLWIGLGWIAVAIAAPGCSHAATEPGVTTGGSPINPIVDAGLYTLTRLGPTPSGSCDVHATQPSQFVDATAQWGLSGVSMTTLHSVDLDHDGYPDLILFSDVNERETIPIFFDGGFHNLPDGGFNCDMRVLMNRPAADGGRQFVDETLDSGLFQIRGGSTTEYRTTYDATFADVDNDGNVDVMAWIAYGANPKTIDAGWAQDRAEVLINDGQGHFHLAPQSDLSTDVELQGYQGVPTDVDNDGNVDLLLTYWFVDEANGSPFGSQPQLLKGNGDGTFTAITDAAGLETDNSGSNRSLLDGNAPRPSFGALACDLNGDGYPELLVSSYGGESNMLYVNDGTGKFSRYVQDAGLFLGGVDGDEDIDYHDNNYYLCYCTLHKSSAYCAGAARPAVQCPTPADAYWEVGVSDSPAELNGNNFSAACRSMSNSALPDIFQGTIRHWWAGQSTDPSTLIVNATQPGGPIDMRRVDGGPVSAGGNGVTYPHIDPEGWNEGIQQTTLVDMDNDGRPDILNGGSDYSYQYGHLFIQQADGTYADMAAAWGLIFPCMDQLEVADFDRDGDLDVVVRGSLYRNCSAPGWSSLPNGLDPGFKGYTTEEVHIFTNNASEHANWLEVRLRGDGNGTNTMGIGANVTLTANGITQVQQLQAAHGILSETDDTGVLFFGLGNCGGVDQIQVRWPNRALQTDTWTDVPANHFIELRQGDPGVYAVNLPQ